MGENGCPIECDSICNSDARERILLKNCKAFFFQVCDFLQGFLAKPNLNMGPYGKREGGGLKTFFSSPNSKN